MRHSTSVKLLRLVFGVYCLVAFTATAMQMIAEYRKSEDAMYASLAQHQLMMERTLAEEIWHVNIDKLNRTLEDIMQVPEIVGVLVLTENERIFARRGLISAAERFRESAELGDAIDVKYQANLPNHQFALPDDISNGQPLGSVIFFSSQEVVLGAVSATFAGIIASAAIKTLALWVIFVYFGRRLLDKPLARLSDAIDQVNTDEHSPQSTRTALKGKTELDIATAAFEELRGRLDQTLDALRMANSKLNDENFKLGRALGQTPLGIALMDPNNTMYFANPAIVKIADSDRETLLNSQFDDFLHKLLGNTSGEYQFSSSSPDSYQEFRQNNSSDEKWLGIRITEIIDDDGEFAGRVLFCEDISDRKHNELVLEEKQTELQASLQDLRQTQKKLIHSEKLASLGQLSAGVAHEINNPLAFIKSNVSTLSDYATTWLRHIEQRHTLKPHSASDSTPGALQCQSAEEDIHYISEDLPTLLEETMEGIERVQEIVEGLKSFAHSDNDNFADVDVNTCLKNSIKIAWNELKYRCSLEEDLSELPQIYANQGQLIQVFTNFLVNAAQAIEERGVVGVSSVVEDHAVRIDIWDTGSGISESNMQQLFTPFFSTKPAGSGTGLGLSISQGIISKHNGTIDVESKKGEGTRFIIRLPITGASISNIASFRRNILTNDPPSDQSPRVIAR